MTTPTDADKQAAIRLLKDNYWAETGFPVQYSEALSQIAEALATARDEGRKEGAEAMREKTIQVCHAKAFDAQERADEMSGQYAGARFREMWEQAKLCFMGCTDEIRALSADEEARESIENNPTPE